MTRLLSILILLCAGCAAKHENILVPTKSVAMRPASVIIPAPVQELHIDILMQNMDGMTCDLQQSTNLVDWFTIVSNISYGQSGGLNIPVEGFYRVTWNKL